MFLLLTAAAMIAASPAHADKMDEALKSRDTMIAAVALMTQLPPTCAVDNKRPEPTEVARFIVRHVYRGDTAFMADVKAKMKEQDNFDMRREEAEIICGWGLLLTAKVREANKL